MAAAREAGEPTTLRRRATRCVAVPRFIRAPDAQAAAATRADLIRLSTCTMAAPPMLLLHVFPRLSEVSVLRPLQAGAFAAREE